MGTPEDIITIEEAASILGVTTQMVHKLVSDGMLRAITGTEGEHLKKHLKKHFRQAEVAAYAEVRAKSLTLSEVAMMAQRAYAMSCSNERRLTNLTHALGLNSQVLETSEEAVVSLVIRMGDAEMMATQTTPDPSELMEWARIFFAVTEGYLGLVASYTSNEEPWAPFLHLAQALVVTPDLLKTSRELEEASSFFEAARRNLRHVAYFYVWERYGTKKANQAFDTKEDYATPILGLLFPH